MQYKEFYYIKERRSGHYLWRGGGGGGEGWHRREKGWVNKILSE